MASLKITNHKAKHKDEDDRPPLHPLMPKYDYITALTGPTGSGKSVALYDMLVNPMLGGKFDFILIISPTLFTDKLWEELATGETKLPKLPNKKRPHLLVLMEYDQPKIDKLLTAPPLPPFSWS